MAEILKAAGISKSYDSRTNGNRLVVLNDLSFSFDEGSIYAIVGSSGSGKSTLLHILGGLDKPDTGDVFWKGESLNRLDTENLASFRNSNMGFVFQFHHLLPEFSALENVAMPALISGKSLDEVEYHALELLERFGVKERAGHRPGQLSGGEQQRVAMARALMNQPEIILADEPTGNLDPKNTTILLDMLFELKADKNLSMILITHEMEIARRADNVLKLEMGKITGV